MRHGRTEEFRKDAVRIALTSGLTRRQVADDLGVHCPAGECVHLLSIRIGQAGYSTHFRRSRINAFAMTMSLRMTAVMANFLHFPVDISCSYFVFKLGLKRVAITAGK